jgi:hypothetical protein
MIADLKFALPVLAKSQLYPYSGGGKCRSNGIVAI